MKLINIRSSSFETNSSSSHSLVLPTTYVHYGLNHIEYRIEGIKTFDNLPIEIKNFNGRDCDTLLTTPKEKIDYIFSCFYSATIEKLYEDNKFELSDNILNHGYHKFEFILISFYNSKLTWNDGCKKDLYYKNNFKDIVIEVPYCLSGKDYTPKPKDYKIFKLRFNEYNTTEVSLLDQIEQDIINDYVQRRGGDYAYWNDRLTLHIGEDLILPKIIYRTSVFENMLNGYDYSFAKSVIYNPDALIVLTSDEVGKYYHSFVNKFNNTDLIILDKENIEDLKMDYGFNLEYHIDNLFPIGFKPLAWEEINEHWSKERVEEKVIFINYVDVETFQYQLSLIIKNFKYLLSPTIILDDLFSIGTLRKRLIEIGCEAVADKIIYSSEIIE